MGEVLGLVSESLKSVQGELSSVKKVCMRQGKICHNLTVHIPGRNVKICDLETIMK